MNEINSIFKAFYENNILHNKCIKEIITLANNIYNKKNIKLEEKIENKNTKILKFERK